MALLSSCSTTHRTGRFYAKTLQKDIQNSPVFANSFTGFTLLDPESGKVLCDVNGGHFFTPASNTKILTLYTCLHVLGDSLPGIKLFTSGDSLFFRGTGDPTFLHPLFQAWQPAFHFLKSRAGKVTYLSQSADLLGIRRLGSGWAWDDFDQSYSAEMNAMPSYGNVAIFEKLRNKKIQVLSRLPYSVYEIHTPGVKEVQMTRAEDRNTFIARYDTSLTDSIEYKAIIPLTLGEFAIPLFINRDLFVAHKNVPEFPKTDWSTLYSAPVDTVYRRMMYESDNFVAEQLLLMCSALKFDTMNTARMIHWAEDSLFQSLVQKPRWVDGSGLSRYNLNTPRNNAEILRRLWTEQSWERLRNLFPAGGVAGTISQWYKGKDGQPYIYAKSGSMSGIYCLSGYLKTEQGKVLIFSFMHNNFVGSNRRWKEETQRFLAMIRDQKRPE